MDSTIWMKKCVVSIQIWIKRVSMKKNVVKFFWGKECTGTPQWPLGFATTLNMWDLASSPIVLKFSQQLKCRVVKVLQFHWCCSQARTSFQM